MTPVFRKNDRGDTVLSAYAYEFERSPSRSVKDEEISWQERVWVVYSTSHAAQPSQGLEQRLATAQEQLAALTPSAGRGKRQITDEETLKTRIEPIIKAHRVQGLLHVE